MDFHNKIKIFYDGVNIDGFGSLEYIKGYTTNPTLMRKGTQSKNYKDFAINFLKKAKDLPVSFEVFADDLDEIIEQAKEISTWGKNIYIKIPIINTKGESTERVITKLNDLGIKVNITAVFTKEQIDIVNKSIDSSISNIISIFSGRIADTGINPIDTCKYAVELLKNKNIEVLWASSREVYNIFQAIDCGCHIITVSENVFKKIHNIGKDLSQFSLETVKMFRNDAINSGIKL